MQHETFISQCCLLSLFRQVRLCRCRVHISVSLVVGVGLRRAAGEGVGPGDDRQGARHHVDEPQVRH